MRISYWSSDVCSPDLKKGNIMKDLVSIVDKGEASRGFIKHATAFAAAQDAHLAISLMMDIFDNAAVLPPFDYYPVILDRIDDEAKRRTEAVKAAVEGAPIPVEIRPVADALAYLGGASRVEGRYDDLLLIGGASDRKSVGEGKES